MKILFEDPSIPALKIGKIVFEDYEMSREDAIKMLQILKDLAETNSYELPYRGEELISRAINVIGKSKR